MIGKIKKGKSFGGCIRYVMGKDNAEIIESDGVLLENIREITASFNYQRELNPKIKQPVGHIALSFKPEDKALLTDEFMAKIAREYMELMGIRNTQFILVRHHNTDNPHCHLVYNRIGYDGRVISSQGDYKRNEIATKVLKDRYGLTYAEDKGKTNVEKLHASERVKRNLQCRQGGFEALRNMERVQRLSASPGHQAGICKAYQGDKKAGGHTGNPVH